MRDVERNALRANLVATADAWRWSSLWRRTHGSILPELADICNKIGIIDRGVMTVNLPVAEMMKRLRKSIVLHVRVASDFDAAAKLLEQLEIVESIDMKDGKLKVTLGEDVEDYWEVSTQLVQHGHKLLEFREDELNLESAFMALTKGT